MRVALVHDDLMQWGGAEKVFCEISNIFPDAPIYTALVDFKNPLIAKNFKGRKIITSFLQKIPFHNRLYKPLLPLYPIAFEQFDFSKFDLVLSHTTRFAKAIITKPKTIHVCYIHTPPRFLWDFFGEDRDLIQVKFFSFLKKIDLVSATRVDFWIAGSENCRQRVKKIYKAESRVLYPFVNTEKFNPNNSFSGDYYLIISRLNKYKKVDIAVEAFNKSGKKLIIVGTGPELRNLKNASSGNIQFVGKVSDELLESLISGCRALIITAEEDFGMTAIEAQSFGKGVICFRKGGTLETVLENTTGVYFDKQSSESLKEAIEEFDKVEIDPQECFKNARRFSRENFRKNLIEILEKFRF